MQDTLDHIHINRKYYMRVGDDFGKSRTNKGKYKLINVIK